MSTSDVLH